MRESKSNIILLEDARLIIFVEVSYKG